LAAQKAKGIAMIKTPSGLQVPVYLMNFPFTLDTGYTNNALMVLVKDKEINHEIAFSQFLTLYHHITKNSLVYLLPSEGNFQDQTYVANLGCYLPHIKDRDIILMSNFKSIPRQGEEKVGVRFFTSMGYEIFQSPYFWEGEADLKYLQKNIYIAGYGQRTDIKTHDWMHSNFNMDIIPIEMNDPMLYHLDCLCHSFSENKVLLATSTVSPDTIKTLEKIVEVIPIPSDLIYMGLTNTLRIGNTILMAGPNTDPEKKALDYYINLCSHHNLSVILFNLSEFAKSGADLSCMFMRLNFI
jgi:N-dimethylarginine dimethylaminohydrolase